MSADEVQQAKLAAAKSTTLKSARRSLTVSQEDREKMKAADANHEMMRVDGHADASKPIDFVKATVATLPDTSAHVKDIVPVIVSTGKDAPVSKTSLSNSGKDATKKDEQLVATRRVTSAFMASTGYYTEPKKSCCVVS